MSFDEESANSDTVIVQDLSDKQQEYVLVGHVSSVHGIKGWLKIHSYCEPKENIFSYSPWKVVKPKGSVSQDALDIEILDAKPSGKTLIAKIAEANDRTEALTWVGSKVYVTQDQLGELEKGEYYWRDLLDLQVYNQQDKYLGQVSGFLETGANDVLVVKAASNDPWGKKERLIPFVVDIYILNVDTIKGIVTVDWEPDF
ncbi:MAG: ribosome maturation factor RimM [Pseudomonadota bacterium]